MITAFDSSVIWAIVNREAREAEWRATLEKAAEEGALVACRIGFAELAPAGPDLAGLAAKLGKLGIAYDNIILESAHLAGTIFKRYRVAGGPRQHHIPDFLIAAHATVQADRLAAIDRGHLRSWFPNLQLLNLDTLTP
jgi:predicted nucleic acid-binding protein